EISWIRYVRANRQALNPEPRANNLTQRLLSTPFLPFNSYKDYKNAMFCIKHMLTDEVINDLPEYQDCKKDLPFKNSRHLKRIAHGMARLEAIPEFLERDVHDRIS